MKKLKVAMLTVLRLDMLEQYKLARKNGIEIDVFTTGVEPKNIMAKREYIKMSNLGEIIERHDVIGELKNYDVITGYEFYGELQKEIMKNFDNFIPEVAWNIPTYGTYFGQEMMEQLNLAKTKVKAFIAKSQSVYDCLVQDGIDEDKIHLLNAPCDTKRFKPRPKPEHLKDKLVFLFIGRIVEQKGIFEMFHAFKRANIKNSKLIMIGEPHPTNAWDLSYLKKWAELTKTDIEVYDFVPQDKIHEFYSWGDVFISIPNTHFKYVEQIGLTIPQALASGLPVITNDFGGQIDYVNRNSGFLIPHKNYVKVAEAMKKLSNDKKRKKMSDYARKKAVEDFGLLKYIEKVKEVYKLVLK